MEVSDTTIPVHLQVGVLHVGPFLDMCFIFDVLGRHSACKFKTTPLKTFLSLATVFFLGILVIPCYSPHVVETHQNDKYTTTGTYIHVGIYRYFIFANVGTFTNNSWLYLR